jgi:hypothetical protein
VAALGLRRRLVIVIVALDNSSGALESCTALGRLGVMVVACGSGGGALESHVALGRSWQW